MGVAFQMDQILWDFISQCEIWHVWFCTNNKGEFDHQGRESGSACVTKPWPIYDCKRAATSCLTINKLLKCLLYNMVWKYDNKKKNPFYEGNQSKTKYYGLSTWYLIWRVLPLQWFQGDKTEIAGIDRPHWNMDGQMVWLLYAWEACLWRHIKRKNKKKQKKKNRNNWSQSETNEWMKFNPCPAE